MKLFISALAGLLLTPGLWAQAPAQSANPSNHHDMMAMHQEHMQEMKDQLDKMHAKLEEMKANLAKVKDPAARQQVQLDVDLWTMLASHMEGMQKMMADGMEHGGMGMHHDEMAMHHDGEMGGGCCTAMKEHAEGGAMKCMQGMHHEGGDKPGMPAEKD